MIKMIQAVRMKILCLMQRNVSLKTWKFFEITFTTIRVHFFVIKEIKGLLIVITPFKTALFKPSLTILDE